MITWTLHHSSSAPLPPMIILLLPTWWCDIRMSGNTFPTPPSFMISCFVIFSYLFSDSIFSATERLLIKYIQSLFPHERIHYKQTNNIYIYIQSHIRYMKWWLWIETLVNVHKNLNIKYPDTNDYMEFDAWIPKHSLCFEFQVSSSLLSPLFSPPRPFTTS